MSSRRSQRIPPGVAVPVIAGGMLAAAILVASGCLERRDMQEAPSAVAACASCHGDPSRAGDVLRRAAPPRDLLGNTDAHNPGVGAHSIHLDPSKTHGAIPCAECHVVPEHVDSPGHADSARPAEVVFGALAKQGGRTRAYDSVARICGNTYCHRRADAVWTEPKTSEAACGSCHGLPPPAPHPQSERCSICHGAVVDAARNFVAPALHVNGTVEFSSPSKCNDCHGNGNNPAPPLDVSGSADVTHLGVGAHQVHLTGGTSGRPLACDECHIVPGSVLDPGHIDGLPAEVQLTGAATSGGREPVWIHASATCSNTWCHGPDSNASSSSPKWNETTTIGCTSCHGNPPAAPHPQMTDCSLCHGAVIAPDDITIASRAHHVDGQIDVAVPTSCTACHGGPIDPAPVPGTPGSGAHRTHLDGTSRSRKVLCSECHVVPQTVLAPGHIDTPPPAEVIFSGVAITAGATPVYTAPTCNGTPCHGAAMPDGFASGGANTTPDWTRVDGTQATCGSCHAIPPPAPHPDVSLDPVCSGCHKDIASDNLTFTRPDLHVDGNVTFDLPP